MWTAESLDNQSIPVFTPVERPRFAIVMLADLDGTTLQGNATWTDLFERHRVACVCPSGAESWWVDRPCATFPESISGERYLRHRIVPWVRERFELPAKAIGLIGLGAGGAGAIRLGLKCPQEFRAVAGIESIVDFHEWYGQGTTLDTMYDSREQCRQDTPVLHVHPSNWPPGLFLACAPHSPFLRGNDRLHEKLAALGVPHRVDFESLVCGHSWDYYDRQAPAVVHFIATCLDRESRKLDVG